MLHQQENRSSPLQLLPPILRRSPRGPAGAKRACQKVLAWPGHRASCKRQTEYEDQSTTD